MSVERNDSFVAGRPIRSDKDPAFRYIANDFSNAPDFIRKWAGAGPEQTEFVRDVIRYLSMNSAEQKKYLRPAFSQEIDISYRENYHYLQNAYPKLNANPTALTIEQILAQDRHFHRTYEMNKN